MSLRVRVYGKDNNWFQLFSNNEFPKDFQSLLIKNGATITEDGCCEKIEIDTLEFIKYYEDYCEDICNWCLENNKQIVPIQNHHSLNEKESILSFSDKLMACIDESAVLQLYLLWDFLSKNDIAIWNFMNPIIKEDKVIIESK